MSGALPGRSREGPERSRTAPERPRHAPGRVPDARLPRLAKVVRQRPFSHRFFIYFSTKKRSIWEIVVSTFCDRISIYFSINFRGSCCNRARAATDARHRPNTACSGTKRTSELARQSATTIENRSANDRENDRKSYEKTIENQSKTRLKHRSKKRAKNRSKIDRKSKSGRAKSRPDGQVERKNARGERKRQQRSERQGENAVRRVEQTQKGATQQKKRSQTRNGRAASPETSDDNIRRDIYVKPTISRLLIILSVMCVS